jgi:hypothetical protein
MTLVTISAAYGAGGSRIAPAVAERLDVPFLGRPAVPELFDDAEADACREGAGSGGGLLSRLTSMAVAWGTPAGLTAEELLPDQARRHELETEILAFAEGGEGVILGRGAVVVLHDDPRVLHVLLDGTVEARTRQAMVIEDIDRATAHPGGPVRRPRARAGRLPPRARLHRARARRVRRAHRGRRPRPRALRRECAPRLSASSGSPRRGSRRRSRSR